MGKSTVQTLPVPALLIRTPGIAPTDALNNTLSQAGFGSCWGSRLGEITEKSRRWSRRACPERRWREEGGGGGPATPSTWQRRGLAAATGLALLGWPRLCACVAGGSSSSSSSSSICSERPGWLVWLVDWFNSNVASEEWLVNSGSDPSCTETGGRAGTEGGSRV